jgi:hypothetical protein
MALFKKIDEKDIGTSPVVLSIMESDDGIIVGRVVAGNDEFFSTAPYDPVIEAAISIADRLATGNKVAGSVYDPQSPRQPSWLLWL